MFLNQVVCGSCLDLLPQLPDRSVDLVFTSPPYAQQRRNDYMGIPEAQYPYWCVTWMSALRPKLKKHGSVFVNLRAHIKNGQVSDYVLRTRLALREAGWNECDEFVWWKPDAPPLGDPYRPRQVYESVLWYSLSRHPYANLRACSTPRKQSGGPRTKQATWLHSRWSWQAREGRERPRITNLIQAYVGSIDPKINHPAMMPRSVPSTLIKTFSKPNAVVLDPFAGSGTTLLAAQEAGRQWLGFDLSPKFAELARQRLGAMKSQAA